MIQSQCIMGFHKSLILTVGSLIIATGCAPIPESTTTAQPPSTIMIDGSSTVYPITSEIALEYQQLNQNTPEIQINVSGTGGGFRKFCAGETEINNASRPILTKEMETCKAAGIKYIEIPVAYDALTLVINPKNNWAAQMTLDELKKIWEPAAEGQITNWSQVREGFPDEPINLYGAGQDSGTFDYFTEAVIGEAKASRQDYIDSEDDTVLVKGVVEDPNGLGYFGYSYYEENINKLKPVAIDQGRGAVIPSRDTVKNGEYQPLSRPLLIYVNAEAAKNPEVKAFVEYYLGEGRQFVKQAGSVPLTNEMYNLALANFQENKVGTVFEGKSVLNLKITDLLQKQAQF